MAFDSTYLTTTLVQMKVHNRIGMIGGVYNPDKPDACIADLQHKLEFESIRKASAMLQCLVWDPCSEKRHDLSIAEIPAEHGWGGPNSGFRGNLYVLKCIGQILQKSDGVVRGVIFDAALTHSFLKKMLLGQTEGLPMEEIKNVEYFKSLVHKPLPKHPLPRLPCQFTYHEKNLIWGLPGVCALVYLGR